MLLDLKCSCGKKFVWVPVISKRDCINCPNCYRHFTYSNLSLTQYAKEQQCPCYEIKAYKTATGCCYDYISIQSNWNDFGEDLYTVCPRCLKVYYINARISNQSSCLGIHVPPKPITSKNFIGHYITWCKLNRFAPLNWEVLNEIFTGCLDDKDYQDTLEALYIIQNEGFQLSFMNDKQLKDLDSLLVKLKIRLELFKRIPSGNNMLLAYALIEEITLKKFNDIQTDLDDKLIDKFDKCKALAVGTKYINERQIAFNRSLDLFRKFAKVEI